MSAIATTVINKAEREQAAVILRHIGEAARLMDKLAEQSDAIGQAYYGAVKRALETDYLNIKHMFPGLHEANFEIKDPEPPKNLVPPGCKVCSRCKALKLIKEFYFRRLRNGKVSPRGECKTCGEVLRQEYLSRKFGNKQASQDLSPQCRFNRHDACPSFFDLSDGGACACECKCHE